MPLARTFLLSSKKNMEAFIKPIIDKKIKKISYEVINGGTHQERLEANEGTKIKNKTNFRCLLSEASIDTEYIKEKVKRNEISTQLIGIIGAKDNSNKGQVFLPPSEEQSKIANVERGEFEDDIEISDNFNIKKYGFKKFSELFTDRQLKTLTTFVEELHAISEDIENDIKEKSFEIDGADLVDFGTGNKAYIQAIKVYLGFLVDQLAHHCSSACTWHTGNSQLRNIFNKLL